MPSIISGAPLSALMPNNRQTIRSAANPFDKATVFSIYPQELREKILTVQPSDYLIPAGTPDKPSRLVVGPASWWRDVDPEGQQPMLEITVASIQIADSLVRDHISARLGSNLSDAIPGLFYLPGDVSVKEMLEKFPEVLKDAITKQRNWYQILIRMADADWARANGNPLAVSDTARLAAKELGMDKPWMQDFKLMQMVACVACGNMRNPAFPVCSHCKAVIDPKAAEKLNLTFAK